MSSLPIFLRRLTASCRLPRLTGLLFRFAYLMLLAIPPFVSAEDQQAREHDGRPVRIDGYHTLDVEGWTLHINERLRRENPDLTNTAITLVTEQLQTVRRVLPGQALAFVQTVPIWLSPQYDGTRPKAEYHPGLGWLKKQGRPVELHRCIELTNIRILQQEVKRMPMLMLHELAHAYHDQVLGFDNAKIQVAFERAKQTGSYESVERHNGAIEKAYALTNEREYFAETSEAYFGRNDFYPFNRDELRAHDPAMERLLGELWQ